MSAGECLSVYLDRIYGINKIIIGFKGLSRRVGGELFSRLVSP